MKEKRSLRSRITRCAIALALYLAFLFWVKSLWGLIVVPFIFDAYITKYIPWTWWKRSKNPLVRTLMGWVDAIVFALVAVYFVNNFFFQNYQIPSSSLEKSLLVGDYLFVSKMSYGARIPMTPLTMPLTQHTMPITGGKSYIEQPQWAYRRTAGFGTPKRGDIVVFNFPAGDTVALGVPGVDIYYLAYKEGRDSTNGLLRVPLDSLTPAQQYLYHSTIYNVGMNKIRSNPAYGEVITRPVDRRENYVKRCVALPGDDLQIKDGTIYINGKKQPAPKEVQFTYKVRTTEPISQQVFDDLGISNEDAANYNPDTFEYWLPLTRASLSQLKALTGLVKSITRLSDSEDMGHTFPQNKETGWGRDNYGPIHLPRKGETIKLTLDNLPIYERCIAAYEGNRLEVRGDKIYINGKEASQYTFLMDYYWMMGDNRHNSLDSRYWGFVPEDHIVGRPIVVWLSLDKDKGWFDGKIRWNRLFKWVSDID